MRSMPAGCRVIMTIPSISLIIAQAYLEGIVLGTQDRLMRLYEVLMLGPH